MDTDRPDDEQFDRSEHPVEPIELIGDARDTDDEAAASAFAEPALAAPKSRWVLGTLAGIVVVLLGMVVWSLLYAYLKREYVGVTVVFALAIGYVVREVTRRSDLRAKILASVLTAILCAIGSIVAQVAFSSRAENVDDPLPFFETLKRAMPHTIEILGTRPWWMWAIFGAAVVVAFLSAAPARPKASKEKAASTAEIDAADEGDADDRPAEPGY